MLFWAEGTTPATRLAIRKTLGASWCDPDTDRIKVALFSVEDKFVMSKCVHMNSAESLMASAAFFISSKSRPKDTCRREMSSNSNSTKTTQELEPGIFTKSKSIAKSV